MRILCDVNILGAKVAKVVGNKTNRFGYVLVIKRLKFIACSYNVVFSNLKNLDKLYSR